MEKRKKKKEEEKTIHMGNVLGVDVIYSSCTETEYCDESVWRESHGTRYVGNT